MSIINENKKLEYSLETLEINIDEISSLTKDYLKKKYHKLSLKWHPDKNTENIKESTKKFQEINESYVYLLKNLFNENSNTFVETSSENMYLYRVMLLGFLKLIISGEYLLNVVQEIILNSNILTTSIFENIDVRTAIDLYNLLCKYREVFHINNDILSYVSLLIKEKYDDSQQKDKDQEVHYISDYVKKEALELNYINALNNYIIDNDFEKYYNVCHTFGSTSQIRDWLYKLNFEYNINYYY